MDYSKSLTYPKKSCYRSKDLTVSDAVLGYDKKGEPVALEVWDASKRDY